MKNILETTAQKDWIILSQMTKGQQGIIMQTEETDFRITLMEMGFLPGTPIHVEIIAPLGDPMAIMVSGYSLSIRKKDAAKVWIKPVRQ